MIKRKIPAIIIPAVLLMTSFTAVPISADAAQKNTPVRGGETGFDKYLVMDEGANVPNVTFEYTFSSGEEQSFDSQGRTFAVNAGPTPEKIVFSGEGISDKVKNDCKFEISFSSADSTKTYEQKETTDYVKNLDPGEKYAKKTAALDFSSVGFDEPGIYRYIITETQGSSQGITYDEDNTRVLDVYVVDNTDNGDLTKLKVSGYILHSSPSSITINDTQYGSDGEVISGATAQEPAAESSDYKSQGFTNEYRSYDLTFRKAVSGNQASRDKYFRFDLEITGAVPGTVYSVSYSDDNNENTTDGNADISISKNPNSATKVIPEDIVQPDSVRADADGRAEQTFYLQHGQYITVRGLSEGTGYSVRDGKEDYSPSYTTSDLKDIADSKADVAENSYGIDQDVDISFINTRNGVIPTGVIFAVIPLCVLGIALVGGIVILAVRNRKRKTVEEE